MSRAIYDKLMDAIGNPYGVCGFMGNVKAESGMKSNNLQNSGNRKLGMSDEEYTAAVDNGTYTAFATDCKGYGLCQWTTSGRKAALLAYAKEHQTSIGNEDMQVGFILYELQKSYKNVLTVLQNAASVKEASDYVVKKYERPANQSDAVLNKRAAYGEEFFKEYVLKEEEKMQTGKGLAEYAKSKLGTPYFYGAKLNVLTEKYMEAMHKSYPKIVTLLYMAKARNKKQVGKVNVDCSGLIAGYRKKNIGSSQLRATAKKRLPISEIEKFAVGTVLWKSGHVGVYIGLENGVPMCVEAKGINYGTVKSKVADMKWEYGLTFSDLKYEYDEKVPGKDRQLNPYTEPTTTIKKGCKDTNGTGVSWVQWELREAGFDKEFVYNKKKYNPVKVDGSAGPITDAAIKAFQQSCKLQVDGKCGPATRRCLKAN